jgi:hypothetical protein
MENEMVPRWRLASVLGLGLVALTIWAPNPPHKFKAEFDPKRYPAAALAAMKFDERSRVFTNDEWGDYLIYRLYPRGRVFVDGRSDFYGNDFGDRYLDVMHVRHGWEKTLSRYGVDTILMPLDAPLTGALKESSRWTVVYDDGRALVFRPAGAEGAERVSVASSNGAGRDREGTKTAATDPRIEDSKTN